MRKQFLISLLASSFVQFTSTDAFNMVQRPLSAISTNYFDVTIRKIDVNCCRRSWRRTTRNYAAVTTDNTDGVTTIRGTSKSPDTEYSFIQTELRGAAMKLHTKEQSPKEGTVEVEVQQQEPYIPTHFDYLSFLVDSQHVYKAMEDIVEQYDELQLFRNTGLERVVPLEKDILFMMEEYNISPRPLVGKPGRDYATVLYNTVQQSIPAFICHYYNYYFAHTAGGRMIGKQMSSLLLNKKTLEFYKWDRDLNELKDSVKQRIEVMATEWTVEQRKECVDATEAAFQGGGAINSYLSSGIGGNGK